MSVVPYSTGFWDEPGSGASVGAPPAPRPGTLGYRATTPIGGTVPFSSNVNDPEKAAMNDRARIAGAGDVLDQDLRDWINSQLDRGANYEDVLRQVYGDALGGERGYTPEQTAAILRQGELDRLGALIEGMDLTPEQLESLKGNPWLAAEWFGPNADYTRDAFGEGVKRVREGVADLGNRLDDATLNARRQYEGAIDPGEFGLSSEFRSGLGGELDASKKALGLSDRYLAKRGWTPEETQQIADAAGREVGSMYRGLSGEVERRAAAAGTTNPMAVTAAKRRLLNDSAVDSADAVANARTGALNLAKQAEQDIESTRLGAASTGAGLRLGALSDAEKMRLGGTQALTAARLNKAAGVGDIMSRNAATYGGARIGAESDIRSGEKDINQWVGDRVATLAQAADDRVADRNQTALGMKQQALGNKFNAGMAVSNEGSRRATETARSAFDLGREARGWYGSQQEQGYGAGLQGMDMRIKNAGQTADGINRATGNYMSAYNARKSRPGLFDKILNVGLGAVGGAIGGGIGGGIWKGAVKGGIGAFTGGTKQE